MEFQVFCPCGCGTAVTATDAGFSATECTIVPCAARQSEGVRSVNVRKSVAYGLAVPTASYRHATGLVSLG